MGGRTSGRQWTGEGFARLRRKHKATEEDAAEEEEEDEEAPRSKLKTLQL